MRIRPIKTDLDYDAALARIDELWGAEPDTVAGDELDVLITLAEAYEREHHPVPAADPIDVIKFVMDQNGLKQNDLVQYIGSKARVSEILNRKRNLTLAMIRALHKGLGIPLEILSRESAMNIALRPEKLAMVK